jgi:hypothetical protein
VWVILEDYYACETRECWKKGLMMAVVMGLTQMRLIVGNSIIVWDCITFIIISMDT